MTLVHIMHSMSTLQCYAERHGTAISNLSIDVGKRRVTTTTEITERHGLPGFRILLYSHFGIASLSGPSVASGMADICAGPKKNGTQRIAKTEPSFKQEILRKATQVLFQVRPTGPR